MYLTNYLITYVSVSVSIYLHTYLNFYPSIHLYIYHVPLCTSLSVHSLIPQSVRLSIISALQFMIVNAIENIVGMQKNVIDLAR